MAISRYIFAKISETERVRITLADTLTWPELTLQFVSFLQGSGYIVQGIEVAEYLESEFAFQRKEQEHECQSISTTKKVKKKKK